MNGDDYPRMGVRPTALPYDPKTHIGAMPTSVNPHALGADPVPADPKAEGSSARRIMWPEQIIGALAAGQPIGPKHLHALRENASKGDWPTRQMIEHAQSRARRGDHNCDTFARYAIELLKAR